MPSMIANAKLILIKQQCNGDGVGNTPMLEYRGQKNMQSTQYFFFFKLSRRLDILDKPEFASLLILNILENVVYVAINYKMC